MTGRFPLPWRAVSLSIAIAMGGWSAAPAHAQDTATELPSPLTPDHVRLPGIIQCADGSYAAEALGLDIDEMTALRATLIRAAVAAFDPDLLIVDEEPAGFRGELLPTLEALTGQRRSRIVLGLVDVRGERNILAGEWRCKKALEATERYYDEVWVHGSHCFHDPSEDHRKKPAEAGAGSLMDRLNCMKWSLRTRFGHAPEQQSAAE